VDRVRAGEDEQAARVAVETVDHARALGVLTAGHPARERLHQRARPVPAPRMDDDAGGLVDDDQVLVLPRDREGRGRRLRLDRRLGGAVGDPLPARQHEALRSRPPVDRHEPRVDQLLRRGA
jgi:hypothetical protein